MCLQKLDDGNVLNVHESHHVCPKLIHHIASEMGARFVTQVKQLRSKNSITIDDSMVMGRHLIIFLSCDKTGEREENSDFWILLNYQREQTSNHFIKFQGTAFCEFL